MSGTLRRVARRNAARAFERIRSSERGLTTLEYVIGAGIILVVLAAGILAWNQGLVQKIGELLNQLLSS
jgi:Flp pilus assembly pilin Flp